MIFVKPNTPSDSFLKALQEVKTNQIEPDTTKHFNEHVVQLPDGGQTTPQAVEMHLDGLQQRYAELARSGSYAAAAEVMRDINRHVNILARHKQAKQEWTDRINASLVPASGSTSVPYAPNGGVIAPIVQCEDVKSGPSLTDGKKSPTNPIIVDPRTGTVDKIPLNQQGQKFNNPQ